MAVSRDGRPGEPPVLAAILDGLLDRMQRAPLMRKAPAQCAPEEQQVLATLLGDLMSLRQARSAVESLAGPSLEQVNAYWPELAALLGASRRVPVAARLRGREPAPALAESANLFESAPPAEPETTVVIADQSATPEPDALVAKARESGAPDLAHLLLEALTVQGRALNTTQMLAWLAERGTQATREEVTTTLFRHEEFFRKRGPGHWVVASQEGS